MLHAEARVVKKNILGDISNCGFNAAEGRLLPRNGERPGDGQGGLAPGSYHLPAVRSSVPP